MASRSNQCPGSPADARKQGTSSAPKDGSVDTNQQPSDPFYGHEKTAQLCSRFITDLFPGSDRARDIPQKQRLPYFIAYALYRTKLHQSVVFAGLLLLQRLKERFPAARASCAHRLFLSAYMIASKVVCDDTYSNKSWSIVSQGMFDVRSINQMERELCSYLEWQLAIETEELAEFEDAVRRKFSDSSKEGGVVAFARRQITKTLRALGLGTNHSTEDVSIIVDPDPGSTEPEETSIYATCSLNESVGDLPPEVNIYGGEFTNVEGDQTKIYVTVLQNCDSHSHSPPPPPSSPPPPPPPPPHQSPQNPAYNNPPNPHSPSYIPQNTYTPPPPPPVSYPPPFVYGSWLVPYYQWIPSILSYAIAGWMWIPHIPFHWSWGWPMH